MQTLLKQIRSCEHCVEHLPMGANPIVQAHPESKIVIIGQAPGIKVHQSSIPWDDASGRNLRRWLNISEEKFYDPKLVALIPMGFCYPGRGSSGDLPPRKECAALWHEKLWEQLPSVELTLLIGQYAQKYYLGDRSKSTLTETVKHFNEYLPQFLPLPHPSPRNNIWMKKNSWFAKELIPFLHSFGKKWW